MEMKEKIREKQSGQKREEECGHLMYLSMNFLWNSDLMVSFTKFFPYAMKNKYIYIYI